jgi:adenosine deaminase
MALDHRLPQQNRREPEKSHGGEEGGVMLQRFALFTVILFTALPSSAAETNEARTARAFSQMPPAQQRIFLQQMPKGGDLHNHFDGAIYAENYIRWAIEDDYCIKKEPPSFAPPPCDAAGLVPASALLDDKALYNKLIDSLSMRNFMPGTESAHDHAFNTFPRFLSVFPGERLGDMFAEVAARLARQNTFYTELIAPGVLDALPLAAALSWDDNLSAMEKKLDHPKLQALVQSIRQSLDKAEKRKTEVLHCGTPAADRGCNVTIRYDAYIIRFLSREQVFAQIALAAALVKADPRIVTLNLVVPEDDPVALRDYKDHMRMVGFFTNKGRDIKVTLHAGELAPGLVPPEDLRNHIRLALDEAGAKRIGHGTDIAYEDNADALLQQMARDKILVEINLTSNDMILGVKGNDHPFPLYRRYGVPVALSSDDEGVMRIDLTHEYQRAAATYNLNYSDLKALARNALEYSFMKPEEKAKMLQRLESSFQKFEAIDWSKY